MFYPSVERSRGGVVWSQTVQQLNNRRQYFIPKLKETADNHTITVTMNDLTNIIVHIYSCYNLLLTKTYNELK